MLINPVNSNVAFGRKLYLDSAQMGGREVLLNEAQQMDIAKKKAGVDTPQMVGLSERNRILRVAYEMNDKFINIEDSPITEKHLQNLFKNFFAMDKIGMLHGDLSLENLYFSDDGEIMVTGFKNAAVVNNLIGTFKGKDITEKGFPSNAKDFEEDALQEYLSYMVIKEEQIDFLKTYMRIKSDYHKQRADFLIKEKGLKTNDDIVKSELAKAEVCANPGKKVIDFELEKHDLYFMNNIALELWKDGCGKADGIKKPNQKINAVLLLLDNLRTGLQLRDTAEDTSSFADNNTAKYFKSEAESMNSFNEKLLECINLAAKRILTPKTFSIPFHIVDENIRETVKRSRGVFDDLYSKIDIKKPYDETKKAIDNVARFYGGLAFSDASIIKQLPSQPKKAQAPQKTVLASKQKETEVPLKYIQVNSDSARTSAREEKQSGDIINYETRKRRLGKYAQTTMPTISAFEN